MLLRRALPVQLRWRMALRWVVRAEEAEDRCDLFPENELIVDKWGREAIACYLRAWKWVPLEHPHQIPPPEDLGSHPADETLYTEDMDELVNTGLLGGDWPTIPCIMCGDPIPRARVGASDNGEGRYCDDCK